ncbi:MAG: peptide deformylase [Epulopiscium sp.]|nr:peptide deformylase [Candidatus Epulonipiscium sp.]
MALRQIRLDSDEILRKRSKEVTEITPKILTLIEDMIETMHDADGVGLAAPQVGILRRIIVVDIGDENGPIALINPRLIKSKGEQIGSEGCLSIPGVLGEVNRPQSVVVVGLNPAGEEVQIESEDLLARVFCHEIDHLDGVLFTDKVIQFIED